MQSLARRTLVALASLVLTGGGALLGATPATAASSGINDWSCQPSSAHPEPVVLVHGMGANKDLNFFTLGPQIRDAGYCVYSLTYGTTTYGSGTGGLASMRTSAKELGAFVDKVRGATGAAKVDLVGHSEGSTVPAYYLKFEGGSTKVDNVIGFGSNYKGTTLSGLGTLGELIGFRPVLDGVGCPACAEYLPSSEFMADLNSGGTPVVPGPTYLSIISRYDTVVTPYTSGRISAANARTIVIQDVCPWDFTGHIGQAVDPNVSQLVLRELDPAHAKPFVCIPFVAN